MVDEKPKITITRSSDFKPMFTTGVFGGLNPVEGHMTFYVDRIIPGMVEDEPNRIRAESVERELQVEIHMSPSTFISLSNWMQSHIQRMEKEGILVRKEEP